MAYTIPKKCRVAVPDFKNFSAFKIVDPEEAFIPAFDRSYHFGDSVYEVIRTYEGILYTYDEHLERLKKSMIIGKYAEFPDFDLISQMVRQTTRSLYSTYGNCNAYIRITVSRGLGDLNIDPRTSSAPYAVVIAKQLDDYPKKMYENGVDFALVDRRRNSPRALEPAMKSGNYLNNVLAIGESTQSQSYDALMLSNDGFVTEGTTNNIFIVKGKTILTPPVSVGILAGITRATLIELLQREGISVQERLFTADDLVKADEIFFTSTTKEIVPVTSITKSSIANGHVGELTSLCMKLFKNHIENFVNTHRSDSLYV